MTHLKSIVFLQATSWLSAGIAQKSSVENRIGLWKGTEGGELGYINLEADDTAYFIIEGNIAGGHFCDENGKPVIEYRLNAQANSKILDFMVFKEEDRTEIWRLSGNHRFVATDQMVLCINFDQEAMSPTSFEECQAITFPGLRL